MKLLIGFISLFFIAFASNAQDLSAAQKALVDKNIENVKK